MAPLPGRGLLRCSKRAIVGPNDAHTHPPPEESILIPLVTTTPQAAAPLVGGRTLADLLRDLVGSWFAHHQRLADLGLAGDA